MIKLYAFGPGFGLPDPSPFCMKAMVLLKMADLPYEFRTCDPRKAPKGKAPFIDDAGEKIADSTFIRWHIEKKYGIDFDAGLSDSERATAWAFQKMCEDHLYWAVVSERWMIDRNFDNGPRSFFNILPAPLRPVVTRIVRKQVRRDLRGQGLGRHTRDELITLARRDIKSLADALAGKPFFMGEQPTAIDATVFASIASMLSPVIETELRSAVQQHANLTAYHDRCMQRWFPDFKPVG